MFLKPSLFSNELSSFFSHVLLDFCSMSDANECFSGFFFLYWHTLVSFSCSLMRTVKATHRCAFCHVISSLSLWWLHSFCSLMNLPVIYAPYLFNSPLHPLFNSPLFSPLMFPVPHAVARLHPGHQVAVGDIVKVTNGQHLPADMVIVSSRSDSVLHDCAWNMYCLYPETLCAINLI